MSCSVEVWSWSDLDPGWPAASWSWSHSDLESLLRWPDDLLKALDAPRSWPEWRWPDPGVVIGCITAPCYRPVLQAGRR